MTIMIDFFKRLLPDAENRARATAGEEDVRVTPAETRDPASRRRMAGTAATLIALVLMGCGGGGGTSGSTTPTTAVSSAGGSASGVSAPVASGGTYDDRVGLGSDASGVPNLAKDANARYIYWNPNHPNARDSNAGTSPDAPKATLKSAWEALRSGAGDWLLMAQGANSPSGFGGSLAARSGKSAQYPIVVTTYDPANPAVMRQGSVKFESSAATFDYGLIDLYNFTGQNVVFENIDLISTTPGGAQGSGLRILNYPGREQVLNVLFHNVRLLGFQATIQSGNAADEVPHIKNVIFRHCVFAYSRGQGLYMWDAEDITIEDSIFYHNGWSADGTRDSATKRPNIRDHNAYFGTNTWGVVYRRNVNGHASSHGLQLRGGGIAHDNVFANNPINLLIGGGDEYARYRPDGVPYDARRNVIVGGANIDSSTLRGFGLMMTNTRNGGTFDDNLIVNVGNSAGYPLGFIPSWLAGEFNVPTYINLTNNIFWNWNREYRANATDENSLVGALKNRGNPGYPEQVRFTYSNNVIHFDATPNVNPQGTGNRNAPATPFPDPNRTLATYASANGYASEDALWQVMIANPKGAWAKSIGDYIRAGYGR